VRPVDPRAAALAADARTAWSAGDSGRARRLALAALALDASEPAALNVLGGIAFVDGSLDEAQARFEAALASDAGFARARFNLGLVALQRGAREAAEALMSGALESGGDADDWLLLGNVRSELGLADAAIAAWHAAVEADCACLPAWVNAGSALRAAGRFAEATGALEHAVALAPDNAVLRNELGLALHGEGRVAAAAEQFRAAWSRAEPQPEAGINLADSLRVLGRPGEAREVLAAVTRLRPQDGRVHKALGLLALSTGARDEAAGHYRRAAALLPEDAEVAHLLAAAEGRPVDSAPAQYVARLFDDFAPRFDLELTRDLDYRIPEELAALLRATLLPGTCGLRVADLGCGTGLVGAALGGLAGRLEGADLSPRMLAAASERNLYARLECIDLVRFLNEGPEGRYDLVVCADVFIYVGRLEASFSAAWRALAPGGRLAFSLETAPATFEGQAALQASGRFAHRPGAVRDLARAIGFATLAWRDTVVRRHNGQPVDGLVAVLERP
jgi:predicted TPR repeat methyltransferase